MAILTLHGEVLSQATKFKIECLNCGSADVEIELDWDSFPSCDFRKLTLICKTCHIDEVLQDHQY